jgi:hypothetical protein
VKLYLGKQGHPIHQEEILNKMTHKKLLSDDKERFNFFNNPEDVGKWNKVHKINDDLKKMMGKWWTD